MILFAVYAQGNHGYPQPDDAWDVALYEEVCSHCGIHGHQVAPFRIRRSKRGMHSHFLQLNWVFDAIFVHADVGAELVAAGISGISPMLVLDARTGMTITDRVRLGVSRVIDCADTILLPPVTCRPNNEESHVTLTAGPLRYPADTPYCGRVKRHPPTSLAVDEPRVREAPDIFQTGEWFGSGGPSFRQTSCSAAFKGIIARNGWRGLQFEPVRFDGHSVRAM